MSQQMTGRRVTGRRVTGRRVTRERPVRGRAMATSARAGLALLLVAVCGLAGCSGGGGSAQVVHVLGPWTDAEQASFLAVVAPFEQRTGIKVDYEGSRDSDTALADRVAGGNPPDLADLSSPAKVAQYAKAGRLTPLDGALDPSGLAKQYAPSWLGLGAVGGKQYAVVVKAAVKSLLWFSPKALAAHGWKPPGSWAELTGLDQRIAASGTPPWCVGLESSSASGWPGTDWLEDIVLAQSGPDVYDRWTAGTLAWTSPQIRQAWQTWGDVVGAPGMVRGGPRGMLLSGFGTAGTSLFASSPGCFFDHEASFITDDYQKDGSQPVAGKDFDFVPFPRIDPAFGGTEEVAGDLLAMFHSTPAARKLVAYLTTPEAQAIWVRRGGALSPNRLVGTGDYPDALSGRLGQQLTEATAVRFDASDQMPDAMQVAFYEAVLSYVNNPSRLDAILADLDRVRANAYG
ncbi:ABC transporter substrate-binding protein [Kitasatospora sp. MAP5-34]|uniref:ABC transporter substrate-binding protein n=1 Tax=Kitasatospora sp. MAP5-34 TaxID=3035102 RepID=UPI0024736081|nr:ABC transporter substrate-binding protein [Kitasatospora sp. MAP5-34]MDH6576177.1 alpha-glucoside transport system substrate-binding protein [Kitasatospora sp. MAP5-34]